MILSKTTLALGAVTLVLSGCAAKMPPADACAAADRPITLSNLVENSLTNVYETCLTKIRAEAVAAVEK